MGCGASKSVQVAQTEVTTTPKPPSPESSGVPTTTEIICTEANDEPNTSSPHRSPRTTSSSNNLLSSLGHHSRSTTLEKTAAERDDSGVAESTVSSSSYSDRYAAFEISVSHDGSTSQKAAPPKRLESLVSAPKVTAEMLSEKQMAVKERKDKELEKRAHTRLSKKERLRKEIMESRQTDNQLNGSAYGNVGSVTESFQKLGDDLRSDYNISESQVDMEADSTFNAADTEIDWDGEAVSGLSLTPTPTPLKHSADISNKLCETEESFDNWG